MKACIIGTGYVGLVSGACLAELGHQVTCVDIDPDKIDQLNHGLMPIHEEGLEEIVTKNTKSGRLQFTTQIEEGLQEATVAINAVGTPADPHKRVNLNYVKQAAKDVAQHLDHYLVFVNKSTVPVGTGSLVQNIIRKHLQHDIGFDVASNPEFLREGSAVEDFMNPHRIVIGVENNRAEKVLRDLYQKHLEAGAPLVVTDIKSAELTKYAANSFLVTKISFINEIANLCEKVGANVQDVARGIGLDPRIGDKFLRPGPGYGGSCFPKDTEALLNTARENDTSLRIIEAAVEANKRQRLVAVKKLQEHFGNLEGKTIAIWGLAFKPETDDVRESSALEVIEVLVRKECRVHCYDPIALDNAKHALSFFNNNGQIRYFDDKSDCLQGTDALVLMTNWKEFKETKASLIAKNLYGDLVVDTRNLWNKKAFEENKLKLIQLGQN